MVHLHDIASVQPAEQPCADQWSLSPDLLEEGLRRAQRLGRPVLLSRVTALQAAPDLLSLFSWGRTVLGRGLFWSRPALGFAMAGAGTAWSLAAHGPERFAHAASAWRGLLQGAIVEGVAPEGGLATDSNLPTTEAPVVGPRVFCGFAFNPCRRAGRQWDGFPDGLLALPRFLLARGGDAAWLVCSLVVQPDADLHDLQRQQAAELGLARQGWRATSNPCGQDLRARSDARESVPRPDMVLQEPVSPAAWQAGVSAVQRELDVQGARPLRKVVLAREAVLSSGAAFQPEQALQALGDSYPDCTIFAFAAGERCFLGATPELLARLERGAVHTAALAGTAARGGNAAEDEQLAAGLLGSAKERSEHELVVRGLSEALSAADVQLDPVGEAGIVRLRNLQHLFTPITGSVEGGRSILELVGRLHPTPAMGGYPTQPALAAIRSHEALDRGWYAGPVGWVDADGGGEFVVGIRSALLRGAEASLFAGCGIVKESDPAREYEESCLKLRPMLTALGAALPQKQPEAGPGRGATAARTGAAATP